MKRRALAGRPLVVGLIALLVADFVSPAAGQLQIPPQARSPANAAGAPAASDNIVFPPDAGIVDVTRDPYNARGDGAADCTAAVQKALDDHPNQGAIVYLPNGTYLITDTLKWPHGDRGGWEEKNTILQGQSRAGAVLRLKDACPGYTDPAQPKAMVWTGKAPAQRFRNAIRNLTLDIGKGNPGAVGAQFMANNQGCVRHVTLRSGDGQGAIGLDLGYTDEQGPCLIADVRVIGFDVGIRCRHAVNGVTFEHIALEGQRQCGLANDGQCVSIRGLASRNAVPVITNRGPALMVLMDATLTGAGAASGVAAIENKAALYARNVHASGYGKAIDGPNAPSAAEVAEHVSHPVLSLFLSPQRALGLPVKETPDVPWDALGDWANGAAGAAGTDITKSLQAAIDSGKTTVYLPRGSWKIADTVVLRGAVRRLIGCEANLSIEAPLSGRAAPMLRFGDGTAPVVVVERLSTNFARGPFYFMEHASGRTLVLASIAVNFQQTGAYRNTGTGPLFIDDVVGADWRFTRQAVWARQFNVENKGRHILNDGGTLWILNLKTEQGGTLIETRGGGRTELVGGFCYSCVPAGPDPMFVVEESQASLTLGEACFINQPYEILVRETRGGQTRELKRGQAPGRCGGSLLPLFAGFKDAAR